MESLKPILLLVVLGGIGYAVYVALNRAPPSESNLDVAPAWNQPVKIETGQSTPPNDMRLGTPSYPGVTATPPAAAVEAPQANSGKSSLPFGAGSSLAAPSQPVPSPSSPAITPPTMPALISPVESQQNSPYGGNPAGSVGMTPPNTNPGLSLPTQPADAELARQRHEFDSAMRKAQSAIQQNQLVDALRELSTWYDHPAVPLERKSELEDLLSQLAGTVIYSREHWLQQAYMVQQGETLGIIAERQQVPWQLLAKINGIDNPNSLVVGEQLKVVRGPFHAQLNRSHNQLALFVEGLYAGQFAVQSATDVPQVEGTYPVSKFAADHPSNSLRQPYISLGGNLFLRLQDGVAVPQSGTMHIGQRDLNDVFDILSDRSQVPIRR